MNESIFTYYKGKLRGGGGEPGRLEGLESLGSDPDLSNSGIRERIKYTKSELHRIVREVLGDKSELYDIADRIMRDSDSSLRILRDEDNKALGDDKDKWSGLWRRSSERMARGRRS